MTVSLSGRGISVPPPRAGDFTLEAGTLELSRICYADSAIHNLLSVHRRATPFFSSAAAAQSCHKRRRSRPSSIGDAILAGSLAKVIDLNEVIEFGKALTIFACW